MKDFAKSYEQLCWKNALESYNRWLPFTKSNYVAIRERAEKRIAELVAEWPQLVKEF